MMRGVELDCSACFLKELLFFFEGGGGGSCCCFIVVVVVSRIIDSALFFFFGCCCVVGYCNRLGCIVLFLSLIQLLPIPRTFIPSRPPCCR